jgi:hypothetical protein
VKIAKRYRPELLVSKGKEANPILMDPYLDAKEDRIVASNGHALVALPVETEKGERSRYLACSLLQAARGLGEPEVPAEIKDQEIVEYGVLWPTPQERTFPDWPSLVPKFHRGDEGTTTVSLNPRLLKALADAMASRGGVALTFQPGDVGPILVQPLSSPAPDELGLLMPLRADDEKGIEPGQRCPTCKKLLAAGAWCEEHGDPLADAKAARTMADVREDLEAAEKVRKAGAAIDGDAGTTITIRSAGREVTATPEQLRAGLAEIDRRKAAKHPGPPPLRWRSEGAELQGAADASGAYRLERTKAGGWTAKWEPLRGRPKILGVDKPEGHAKDACQMHAIERHADGLLRAGGSDELTKRDLKGAAEAHRTRKGGR